MGIDRWLNATLSIRFLECVGDKSVPSRGCSYFYFCFCFLLYDMYIIFGKHGLTPHNHVVFSHLTCVCVFICTRCICSL